ncbi:SsgA family sporulation/cell division regulator [Streptomyces axinellae]|jgi:hypothetical protein|uniref:SsgA family sporulation/cell division regulator n=1 Tax=Streptomyces axinellae TaxID=552788 RepID=A0ABN3PZ71_9ACTN
MVSEIRRSLFADVHTGLGSLERIHAMLYYVPGDPFAVRMRLLMSGTSGDEPMEWTFARNLLIEGVDTPSGVGAVRIWPLNSERIAMSLDAPEGEDRRRAPLLQLMTADILRFLDSSYEEAPAGCEPRPDWDLELASMLRQA